LNDALPADINILSVEKALHRFHARHDALSSAYVYQIAQRRTAFAKPYVWWVKEALDVQAMRAAAAAFAGRNDFHGFTDDDPEEKSTVVEVALVAVEAPGAAIHVIVEGSHFLWKMVRRMVGVLVEVGRGELAAADVPRLLRAPSGIPAKLTAPPSGLFLARVTYPGDPPAPVPRPPLTL
jgi:tRNA pseudouridine38-40 synthase